MTRNITEILGSKLTAKKKAKALAGELSKGTIKTSAYVKVMPALADAELAIVLESLEGPTRKKPELVDSRLFPLLVQCLAHAAPRVRWEAARTIANVAGQHTKRLGPAVDALLNNTADDGKVVRWATAQALAAILRTGYTGKNLATRMQTIAAREEDDGVRGVYEKALNVRR